MPAAASLTGDTAAPQDMSMQRGNEHQPAAKAVSGVRTAPAAQTGPPAKHTEQQGEEAYGEGCCLASCCVAVCCCAACGADHDACHDCLSDPLTGCKRWCYWCGLLLPRIAC
jgi:hypothetical protein